MDWQEKYIESLDKSLHEIKNEIKNIKQESKEERAAIKNDFNSKVDGFMSELRDRDNQRHQEIMAVQQHIDANIAEVKADISSIRIETKESNKWIAGMSITVMLGVAAMVIAVVGICWSVFGLQKDMVNQVQQQNTQIQQIEQKIKR